jgi:hypothetical protein
MKTLKQFIFETSINYEQTLDDLQKGPIFDDAKKITTIFKMSSRTWSDVIETIENNKQTSKVETIKLKDIHITQPNIQKFKVLKMIDSYKNLPLLDVVKFKNGELAIADGHHRLTTLWLLNKNKIQVNLIKEL